MAAALRPPVGGGVTGGVVDIVVAGGGPAGALAARELARAGASVLVLERAPFPRWKVCGSCVGPAAVATLDEAGIGDLPAQVDAVPLRELQVVGSTRGEARLPLLGGFAWSRAALDATLLAEASASGAEVRTAVHAALGPVEGEARVVLARPRGSRRATPIRARVVVDATGLGGMPGGPEGDRVAPDTRMGAGAIFAAHALAGGRPLPPGRIVMVVGRAGYVGLVRLEDGTIDVGAAIDPAALAGRALPEAVASLLAGADLVLDGPPLHGWRGTPALTRRPRRAADERRLRIGDALGYVEPFTGEGIGWALTSARAVVPFVLSAVDRWEPRIADAWDAYRSGEAERARRACRVVSWGLRRPRLVRAVVRVLDRAPWLAAPVLSALTPAGGAPR